MEFITPIAGYWATWGDSGRFLRCRWVMHAALHKNCQWFTCVRCWPRGHQGVNSRSQADEQKRKKRKNEKKIEGRWKLNLKPGWGHTFSVALQLCKITVNAVDLTFVPRTVCLTLPLKVRFRCWIWTYYALWRFPAQNLRQHKVREQQTSEEEKQQLVRLGFMFMEAAQEETYIYTYIHICRYSTQLDGRRIERARGGGSSYG